LTCGSPEAMAAVLYLPQLNIHLVRNKILVEKIFPSNVLHDNSVIDTFVQDVLYEYNKTLKLRIGSLKWTIEAQEWLDSVPSFLQGKIKDGAEEFAKAMGYKEITCDVLEEAKGEIGG